MKRFLAIIAVFLFLFLTITPVFSFAVTVPYSFVSSINTNQFFSNSYIVNEVDTNRVFAFTADYSGGGNPNCVISLFKSPTAGIAMYFSYSDGNANSTITINVKCIDLITGDTYITNRTLTLNSSGSGGLGVGFGDAGFRIYTSVYYYIYEHVDTMSSASVTDITYTDHFVSFAIVPSDNFVYSSIPEPVADSRHFYIADYQFLYEIVLPYSEDIYFSSTGDMANTGYTVTYNFTQSDILNFYIAKDARTNGGTVEFNTFCYKYILSNGEFVSATEYRSSNSRVTIPISLSFNWRNYGIWFSSFIGEIVSNGFYLMQVVWAEGSSIHNDFLAVNTLINSVITNQYDLSSKLTAINNSITNFINISDTFFEWFKNTYYNNWQDYWVAYLQKLTDIYIELNAIDIMMYQYIVPDLQSIKNALVDHTETQPDTSAFDDSISEYEEGESYIVNQAEVALDDLESQLSGAQDVLTVNSRGLLFIKNIFENFAFTGMNYYYMLFVLVIGSVALLIGRRLR